MAKKIRNTDYSIDFAANTITISKKFQYEAMTNLDSPAYDKMTKLLALGFTMVVRESKPRKACPTRITYEKMEQYITCLDDADTWLPRFIGAQEAAKSRKNPYHAMRQWFMANFPEYTETPVIDENGKIVHSCNAETPVAADDSTIVDLETAKNEKMAG